MKINVSNYIVSTCKKWSDYNFISDENSKEIYTYRKYFDKIELSINYLHDSGLNENDFVVIEIDNSIASLALFMGMLVSHIIPILVSPNIKANEMEQIREYSNPKAWFYSTMNKKVRKNTENLDFSIGCIVRYCLSILNKGIYLYNLLLYYTICLNI